MIGCRESARLISEQRDRRLPWRTRVALRLHLALCKLCKVYATQMAALGRISNVAGVVAPDRCPGTLSEERKRRIKEALDR